MPVYIIRTAQRQIAYYEYQVTAPTAEIAQNRVRAGEEGGNNYETDYETELIESCAEETSAD